jgi:ribosomal protein L21E
MVNPKGTRRGTRYMFARKFKKHGVEPLSTFLRVYKRGQIVDIKVCAASKCVCCTHMNFRATVASKRACRSNTITVKPVASST